MDAKETESLSGSLQRAYENHLKSEVSGEFFYKIKSCFGDLLGLCKDPNGDDETILMKFFHEVERGGIRLKLPLSRVELPTNEILRLLELGFRLGRIDPRFEVRVIHGKRVPYWQGVSLPLDRWEEPMPCVLKHEALSELHASGQQLFKEVEELNRDQQAISRRNQYLRMKLEPFLLGIPNPSRSRLTRPNSVSLKDSLLVENATGSAEIKLSSVAKRVQELQG